MNTCRSGPAVPVDRTNPQKEHLDAAWVTTPASRTNRDEAILVDTGVGFGNTFIDERY